MPEVTLSSVGPRIVGEMEGTTDGIPGIGRMVRSGSLFKSFVSSCMFLVSCPGRTIASGTDITTTTKRTIALRANHRWRDAILERFMYVCMMCVPSG